MRKLPRRFYIRDTSTVAKELLGKTLVRNLGKKTLTATIVETEAYLFDDPASHSFRGITERTKVMFGEGGFLYVYFTYGMHYCANVVTYKKGIGEAVLIRAVEPIEGLDIMIKNRKLKVGRHLLGDDQLHRLTNGPAKLAQAFGLTTKHSGIDLTGDDIYISNEKNIPQSDIVISKRIGISVAKEENLRFYIKGNAWISKK